MTDHESLCTPAWMLVGITRNLPGWLELVDGHLAFMTVDEQLFHVPLDQVRDIRFPWYYFGGGVKLTIANERLRFSFVRPNDASDLPDRLMAKTDVGAPFALLTAGRKIADIGVGRRAGKAWKAALTAAID